MDEETPLAPHLAVQQLILSLRQIYSATTTQEVKAAEFSINKHLSSSPLVVIGLLEFLRPPFNSDSTPPLTQRTSGWQSPLSSRNSFTNWLRTSD